MTMKRGDMGLIAVLLLSVVILIVYVWDGGEDIYTGTAYAKITVDGEHYQTVELSDELQELEIRTDRGYNLVRIYNRGVQILDADCPDKLCVHMGVIHKVGERVVCLPNRVLVEIVGQSEEGDGIDAIVS